MDNKVLWLLGPAIYSVIGMIAAYLVHHDYSFGGAAAGAFAGLVITGLALANTGSE